MRWGLQIVAATRTGAPPLRITRLHGGAHWSVEHGRGFSDEDVAPVDQRSSCWAGRSACATLFGGGDPVGEQVRVFTVPLTVIGCWARRGRTPRDRTRTT
ncbi:ABC transporter permease [Azospirillum thermophilum]|uniref:ABC transporter permease n=1 Tax=Azospirillum thermophilum TaxID=2202148 RepID=UPI00318368FF